MSCGSVSRPTTREARHPKPENQDASGSHPDPGPPCGKLCGLRHLQPNTDSFPQSHASAIAHPCAPTIAHSIGSANLNSNGVYQHSQPDTKRFPQSYALAIPYFNLAAHHAEPNAERQTRPSANGGSRGLRRR